MILYKSKHREIQENVSRSKYKLRKWDVNTKREIELSRYIIENVPNWEYYFFSICEVKQTTVRDIYQETIDTFSPQRIAEFVLLRYHRDDLISWYEWGRYFSASYDMKLIYHSYQHCIDLLSILEIYSIFFVGFNDENIQIQSDGMIRMVNMNNGLTYQNDIEDILSIPYRVEKAIYYPIDYYFIQYLEEKNIHSPTIETIENVWYKWKKIIVSSTIGVYFTEWILEQLRKEYLNRYECFINQNRKNIWMLIENTTKEWNRYSLNILYLSIMREKGLSFIEEVIMQSIIKPMKMNSFFEKMIEETDWKKESEKEKIKMYL